MFVNDLEEEFNLKGREGIDVGMLKMFLILYADDIIFFSDLAAKLQKKLDILHEYCYRNRLTDCYYK